MLVVAASTYGAAEGCSLTTDLDGLSSGPGAVEGGTSADAEGDAPFAAEAAARDGAPTSDAALPADAGSDARVVFMDSFDDPTPLPRQWDSIVTSGSSPALGTASDAPSPTGVLSISESDGGATDAYLRKTIKTTATQAFTCSLKMKAAAVPGNEDAVLMWIQLTPDRYVRLSVITQRWKLYGQLVGGPDVTAGNVQGIIGGFLPMRIRLEATGTITVTVGPDVRVVNAAGPLPLDNVRVDVGLRLPNATTSTVDLEIDDVVCTVE